MKLEVGMYVRTKDGRIDKIEDIRNDFIYIENSDYGYRKDYFKASHDIIDLIEVGDYVNGIQVINVKQHLHNDVEIVLTNGLYEWSFSKNESDYNIKSIVTKEQFSSISYEVSK